MTDLTRYADAIFGFCLRRVHSIEDARDLSQDILCEALASLPGADVRCFEAWLWTVARNRYCRYLRDRKRAPLSLEGSRLADTLIADAPALPGPEQQAVFEALHTLAQAHRDILVDHYVRGLSCEQIAQSRGLKSETVRTRLFYGREKLRERWQHQMNENHIYTPQDWFVSGNGDVDVSLLDRQITRSILSACYGGFTSVEQMALATGLPCLYIEDELQRLWRSELVEEKGNRYRANLIIHRDGFAQAAEKLLLDSAEEATDKLLQVLETFMPRMRAIGFSGCDLPPERLLWCLIPRLMREACELARAQNPETARCVFPLRRDGSRGWLCAYESAAGVHRYFSGCNAYYLDGSHFRYYWSASLFSDELNRLLRRLESIDWHSACLEDCIQDPALLAECIRCDLAVREKEGVFRWNIPVFTRQQLDALQALCAEAAQELLPLLAPLAQRLLRLMKAEIPLYLHDQIRGIFGISFNALIDMLCQVLLRRGVLAVPEEGAFAGQVLMVIQSRRYNQQARAMERF